MSQASHLAGRRQIQTEQLRRAEGQLEQCQQRLTSTAEEMSARIASLRQEREATAKEASAASARYGQMEAENASLRPTASDMRKEGTQIVHDVQREREAVAKAVEAARAENAAEVRRLTEHAEAADRRCQAAF